MKSNRNRRFAGGVSGKVFRVALVVCSLVFAVGVGAASADPNFSYDPDGYDPASFQTQAKNCIGGFTAADDLGTTILQQLNRAQITLRYQSGSSWTDDPTPNGDSTGKPLIVLWDPDQTGFYPDGAPKVPCAVLLHELQHAARYFKGQMCTGPDAFNIPARDYEEATGARAENWWLSYKQLSPQRTSYDSSPLGQWTQWPASPDNPVPPAPPCYHDCTGFAHYGCVDFDGGVYSGGDHRGVATGSLKIDIGDLGYCSGRDPCEFRDCYVCPHLDTAFPIGVTVTAIATPSKDSQFDSWGPGACSGQGATCTFTAQRPSCINARFLLTNPTAPPQSLPKVPCPRDP
jgi:hypothetical protein